MNKINELKSKRTAINREIKALEEKNTAIAKEQRALLEEYNRLGWDLTDLNRVAYNKRIRGLNFPRIKTPVEVSRDVRKYFLSKRGWATRGSSSAFVNVLYYDGEQWIQRTFVGVYEINKGTMQMQRNNYTGRNYRVYKEYLAKVIEVARQYEDGRAFKSGRISQFMSGINVYSGNAKSARAYCKAQHKPYVTTSHWSAKYAHNMLMLPDVMDPAISEGVIEYAFGLAETMRVIRYYKKYKLARQLYSLGERGLAFNGQVLRTLKGKKLLVFKNWWKQSEDSGWFRWKPREYADVKRVILDGKMSQYDLYRDDMLINTTNERLIRYLFRQRAERFWDYADYIKLLKENGYPLTYTLLYPKNLTEAHRAMVNHKSDLELEELRIKRDTEVKKTPHYETVIDESLGLMAKPLLTASDFKEFGRYLAHCYKDTTAYWERFLDSEIVLFALCNLATGEPISVAQYNIDKQDIVQNNGARNEETDAEGYEIARGFAKRIFEASL